MSDLIRREDAIHILACEMYAEAQAEGYEVGSIEDYIPEAKAWMSDAPSADITETETCQRCQDLTDTILNRQGDEIKRLKAEARPTGEWKEVYAETDYRNGWIEFSCECCEYQHGLESGEYGWSYGEPIPWKFCPLCGAKMYKDGEDE